MIQEFINWLKFERRVSKHTVISYQNDIQKFHEYLNLTFPETNFRKVKGLHIKSWLVNLLDQNYSPSTISRKIVALNTFYKYMIKEGQMDSNPAANVHAPKRPKRLVKYLEESDITKILDQFEYSDDFHGIRDRLVIEMLYGTGIRLSELIGLKDDDIDLTLSLIKVLGKRNKERLIPLNKTLAELIDKYKSVVKREFANQATVSFFLTDKGKAVYPMMIYRIVKRYLDLYESKTNVSPHVLRHTFATHLLNRGADINAIKELLGHANLAATQVYTHNTIERLKKVHKQAHPRG